MHRHNIFERENISAITSHASEVGTQIILYITESSFFMINVSMQFLFSFWSYFYILLQWAFFLFGVFL